MLTVGGVQVLPGLAETLPDLRRGRCPITSPLHPPQEETQPQHTPQLGSFMAYSVASSYSRSMSTSPSSTRGSISMWIPR